MDVPSYLTILGPELDDIYIAVGEKTVIALTVVSDDPRGLLVTVLVFVFI